MTRMTEQRYRAISSRKPASGNTRTQALGRLKAGSMNKTESAYAEHLKAAQIAGEVALWWFECVGLKVAAKCHYYPDFMVLFPDGRIEIHEVKARNSAGGYRAEDDAKVKLRVCAEKFPFPLVVVWPKQGGFRAGWEREEL